ncbi:helix-turn-helix domain-containing protein [Ruminococcus sp. XPD3002]|uniref:helix-turn-helix domain-containing protein n=1 Tax=Ruminococcus sp. XPD3002 TaxID=1452269 RepID=UPI00091375BB|nr:Plasmid maintenance system antidote protein VapI, contains XRE-type HTH domain [Ruminococcus flavefaciens]
METNDILKKLRTENGLTLGELSEKLDIHKTNLSDLENGRRKIGLSVLTKLADYYNVSLDYIMGREVVQELDNRSDIEKISAENNLTDSDQEFLKQNQEQLVQLLKKKQNEIDELKRENQELRAKCE